MVLAVEVNIGFGELLLYGIPFAIIVGWASGRVLGVRRGRTRAFIAGITGWIVGVLLAAVVRNQDVNGRDGLDDILVLSLAFGLIVAMFVSLVLDILVRPRTTRRHRRYTPLLHPIASLRRALAPLGRCRQIVGLRAQAGPHRTPLRLGQRTWPPPSSPAACG